MAITQLYLCLYLYGLYFIETETWSNTPNFLTLNIQLRLEVKQHLLRNWNDEHSLVSAGHDARIICSSMFYTDNGMSLPISKMPTP